MDRGKDIDSGGWREVKGADKYEKAELEIEEKQHTSPEIKTTAKTKEMV